MPELAQRSRVGVKAIRGAIRRGELRASYPGAQQRCPRVAWSDFESWLQQRSESPKCPVRPPLPERMARELVAIGRGDLVPVDQRRWLAANPELEAERRASIIQRLRGARTQ